MMASFATPPPTGIRAFTSYIVRDIPGVALTGGAWVGEATVFDLINKNLELNNAALVNLELLTLRVSIIPLTVLAGRLTRGISQRIDHFINPQAGIE